MGHLPQNGTIGFDNHGHFTISASNVSLATYRPGLCAQLEEPLHAMLHLVLDHVEERALPHDTALFCSPGCGSKIGTPNGTLVSVHMDQNLQYPAAPRWFNSDPCPPPSPSSSQGAKCSSRVQSQHRGRAQSACRLQSSNSPRPDAGRIYARMRAASLWRMVSCSASLSWEWQIKKKKSVGPICWPSDSGNTAFPRIPSS